MSDANNNSVQVTAVSDSIENNATTDGGVDNMDMTNKYTEM